MRYAIFSDVHSNLEALEAVARAYKNEAVEQYLCVGDVVGYGADPRECIKEVSRICKISVCGNHDWASVDLFPLTYFNPEAKAAIEWTKRNLGAKEINFLASLQTVYAEGNFTLVHGTLEDPQDFNYLDSDCAIERTFEFMQTQLCFVGHTHVSKIFIKCKDKPFSYSAQGSVQIKPGEKYIVNVGSVGQPRDGNACASFCLYDSDKNEVAIKRVDYDFYRARNKIIAAGLPRFLAERLLLGR
jgi:predicted phosphodiesterase